MTKILTKYADFDEHEVLPAHIGDFVDLVSAHHGVPSDALREPRSIAGRILEEVVELALKADLTVGEIFGHVSDAITNETLKASRDTHANIYPSELNIKATDTDCTPHDVLKEAADVTLWIKDLVNALGYTEDELRKMTKHKFIRLTRTSLTNLAINDKGLLYQTHPTWFPPMESESSGNTEEGTPTA